VKNRQSFSGSRWIRFNMVGAIGMGVQLAMLALLTAVFRLEYMLATALAVESAVLHNFFWHRRFTWAGPSSSLWRDVSARFLRFNITTGAVSIAGNLVLMRFLVGQIHVPTLLANLVGIAGCSVVNFLVSDRWVFRTPVGPGTGTTRDI